MQSKSKSTRPANMPLLLRALNWLAERDRRYREARKLRYMPDERLADMGMTRADAETAYRRRRKPARAQGPVGVLRRS